MEDKLWENGQEPWWATWVYFSAEDESALLHRIENVEWDWEYPSAGLGVMKCGRSGFVEVPGVLSRLYCTRCPVCCAVVGVPEGKGTPFNSGIEETVK